MSTELQIYDPIQLGHIEWRQLQTISRAAFRTAIMRSYAEIDEMVSWADPVRFMDSHIDPNTEVGRRYRDNQSFGRPRVAIAYDNALPVGFAYTADNVSGTTPSERNQKKLGIANNYLWLREVVVRPGYQSAGIGKQLGRALLSEAKPLQPVTAYIWPDEVDAMQDTLNRYGFEADGEDEVHVFGHDAEATRQIRMVATSVRNVLSRAYNISVG